MFSFLTLYSDVTIEIEEDRIMAMTCGTYQRLSTTDIFNCGKPIHNGVLITDEKLTSS